jgi:predicted RNA-binding Zn ribbon-like protein
MQGTLPSVLSIPLVTESPCLNFINTIDWRFLPSKRHDFLNTYSDLLAFCLRVNILSTESFTQLTEQAASTKSFQERAFTDARAFRDALISIIDCLTGNPSFCDKLQPEALAIFDAARRKAHESEGLSLKENRLFILPLAKDEGLDFPWLSLVRDAEQLLCSPLAKQIRLCSAEGCGWAFLDQSKNGSRRWCSMQLCGNREKAARFKAKT